jgi:hypothetical protein
VIGLHRERWHDAVIVQRFAGPAWPLLPTRWKPLVLQYCNRALLIEQDASRAVCLMLCPVAVPAEHCVLLEAQCSNRVQHAAH